MMTNMEWPGGDGTPRAMAPPEGTGDAVALYYTQTRSRQGRVFCFSTEDPAPSGAGALHHRVERWPLQVWR